MTNYKKINLLIIFIYFLSYGDSFGVEQQFIHGLRSSVSISKFIDAFNSKAKENAKINVLEQAGLSLGGLSEVIPLRSSRSFPKMVEVQLKNIIDNSTAPRVASHNLSYDAKRLVSSFDGINAWDQRYANGGNNKAFEPPDQGLCVGNGFILESVNSALRVYKEDGSPATDTVDLNAFYGYPPGIDKTTNLFGPFIFDPTCLFDQRTQRWFHVAAVQEVDPVSGKSLPIMHLDIAVSKTVDPTAQWVTYQVPAQNNGTQGTPDHKCGEYCFGDYPHIGADRYGFYLTTNEFGMGPEFFRGAQIYAFSKSALAENQAIVDQTLFDTVGLVKTSHGVEPGFTVWPAQSPKGQEDRQHGGVAYFLSSVDPVSESAYSDELVVWAIKNTHSLNDLNPQLELSNAVIKSEPFGLAPMANQKDGSFPLGECLNDRQELLGPGKDCWAELMQEPPKNKAIIGQLDSNDTRMQQVAYANGKLYAALDSIVDVEHEERAGIAYFVVKPRITPKGVVSAKIARQGYIASQGYHLSYPSFGVLQGGNGVMGFTVVGETLHPSAGYAIFDGKSFGEIYIAAEGEGVQDGKTEYPDLTGGNYRPRWGDYGAVASDGRSIWIASEYISQSCTLEEYIQQPFGTCGGTRTQSTNWATRISEIRP